MDFDTTDLPPDVEAFLRPHLVLESMPVLDAISQFISARRDEARDGRVASGAEAIWRYCEEAYAGIDDANRGEFEASKWHKPMSPDGPLTTGAGPTADDDRRSTIFVGLTARYVDTGASKLAEILLPPDDKAFSINELPDPELIAAKDDTRYVLHPNGQPMMRNVRPDENLPPGTPVTGGAPQTPFLPQGGTPQGASMVPPSAGGSPPAAGGGAGGNVVPFPPQGGAAQPGAAPGGGGQPAALPQPPQTPLTVADFAQEKIAMARAKAKKAEDRIHRWMSEDNYISNNRVVIKDAARLGVGILKAPYPKLTRGVRVTGGKDGQPVVVDIEEKVIPGNRPISPWNFYPDPNCGECVHDGQYTFERDFVTEKQLLDFKMLPGYLKDAIDLVISEGPEATSTRDRDGRGPSADTAKVRNDKYVIWYYHGTLKMEEVEAIEAINGSKTVGAVRKDGVHSIYVIATMVNRHVIKVSYNPLDSGKFPYNAMPWQPRAGSWFGVGIAEQVMSAQRMVNASTRAMMDNAGVTSGAQIVIDQQAIYPADNDWTLAPNKIWYKTGEGVETVEDAFKIFNIQSQTREFIELIQFCMQFAEEASSIPLITQGQSTETSPETWGATQLQNNNANSMVRSIGYIYDDYVTEPVVHRYYEWWLLDPDVDDADKAQFEIEAHGSVTLVDRAIQDQTIVQMKPFVDDPKYNIDPDKYMRELLKSKRIDPAALMMTPDQIKAKSQQQPPQAPAVQVATINADAELKVAMIKEQGADKANQIEREAQQLEGHKAVAETSVQIQQMHMNYQLELLKYANQHKITLVQAQTDLAKQAMTLNTQKELNATDNMVDLHKHHTPGHEAVAEARKPTEVARPPVQSPGRAGKGRAFEQGPPRK